MSAAAGLPPRFTDGVRRFNAGEFFEAHEAFEDLLEEVENDERWDLLLGLIQVAVGYHKCTHGHPGGGRMLGLGAAKLAPFPAVAWGVAVDRLRRRVAEDIAALEAGRSIPDAPPRIELVGAAGRR
jgi:hypothetical protein